MELVVHKFENEAERKAYGRHLYDELYQGLKKFIEIEEERKHKMETVFEHVSEIDKAIIRREYKLYCRESWLCYSESDKLFLFVVCNKNVLNRLCEKWEISGEADDPLNAVWVSFTPKGKDVDEVRRVMEIREFVKQVDREVINPPKPPTSYKVGDTITRGDVKHGQCYYTRYLSGDRYLFHIDRNGSYVYYLVVRDEVVGEDTEKKCIGFDPFVLLLSDGSTYDVYKEGELHKNVTYIPINDVVQVFKYYLRGKWHLIQDDKELCSGDKVYYYNRDHYEHLEGNWTYAYKRRG